MRITVVSDAELVNSNYRAYQPMGVLARRGHELTVNRPGERRFDPASLLASDVVHIHRYADPEMLEMVQRARAAGVGVVWDNDDDITSIPRSNPHYRRLGGPANSARVRQAIGRMVASVDVVTTPSEALADQYRAAGAADVRVLENFLPPEFGSAKPVKHDGVVIAWLAGLEHQADYQQLRLKETFEHLLDAHPDVRFMSIGLGLGLPAERYEHLPLVDFLDLARTLARADVGVAPLADIPWNRARSNIKLKEYAAAGLPWLASPVGPYLGLGEQQGGRLVADDDWSGALDELIVNARARRKLAKRAAKWAKGQAVERHAHLWERALEDARTSAAR